MNRVSSVILTGVSKNKARKKEEMERDKAGKKERRKNERQRGGKMEEKRKVNQKRERIKTYKRGRERERALFHHVVFSPEDTFPFNKGTDRLFVTRVLY